MKANVGNSSNLRNSNLEQGTAEVSSSPTVAPRPVEEQPGTPAPSQNGGSVPAHSQRSQPAQGYGSSTAPVDLRGTWEGPYTQLTTQQMRVKITGSPGALSGKVEYLRDGCSGSWTQTSSSGNFTTFAETISHDPGGKCIFSVAVSTTLQGEVLTVKMAGLGSGGAELTRKTTPGGA